MHCTQYKLICFQSPWYALPVNMNIIMHSQEMFFSPNDRENMIKHTFNAKQVYKTCPCAQSLSAMRS